LRLVYLDQNYASRISKFLLGLPHNGAFGVLWAALQEAADRGAWLAPPSPFHVLELHGGYLLPTFKAIFSRLSGGFWVRPWQDVVRCQAERGGVALEDFLTDRGHWDRPADLWPLWDLLDLELEGSFYRRAERVAGFVSDRLGLGERGVSLPFVRILSRLLAFRSLERTRHERLSDLVDVLMAATTWPYVDILATDRYLKEALRRVGYGEGVFSGRSRDVLDLAEKLRMES